MWKCRPIHNGQACAVSFKCERLSPSCAVIYAVVMNRAVEQERLSKTDSRKLIKFHVLLQKSPSHQLVTHAILEERFGRQLLFLRNSAEVAQVVQCWIRRRSRAPRVMRSRWGHPDHIAQVSALLEEAICFTWKELVVKDQVGISSFPYTSSSPRSYTNSKSLPGGFRMSSFLNNWASGWGFVRPIFILQRFRREGNDFLHRIVTDDEMWARHFEPELKRQSAQWRKWTTHSTTSALLGHKRLQQWNWWAGETLAKVRWT
jgi:hypothetical protein